MVRAMSSKYNKYLKVHNYIKSKKGIEPNNFVFARNLAGKKAVYMSQYKKGKKIIYITGDMHKKF